MEFSFLQLTISIIALAAIAQTSFVQSACDSDCVKGFVAAHNAARQTVGSPPVNWNSTLADIAESYAAKRSADCVPQNSNGLYGENIAVASAELSPADSMKLWMGEKKDYDHASNSCTSGNNCRSYTQPPLPKTSFVQSACDSDCVKGFVAAHNAARQTVGSPPVNWNSTLADIAESYAAKRSADCVPQNSNGLYGENIAVASAELSPADSMKLWMGEKKDYDHASNSCTSGNNCRSYTQVVWGGSTSIGCARVTCKTDWMFVICYYNPPGNYMGEKPY
ncbi:PREDICTED: pathogenesis-related protein 1-like [Ipomoea nil]|uniref:pathogenesis-related protein 1-like n=1 Tax=Ipomoea nil TaxID=35883 RepID=UPI0009019D8B|nr:PREDICTED: pathogenesis-related protein 1-like [Ipomoea nil]